MKIRINKAIADLGLASRRAADTLIEAGRVVVNGRKAHLGDKIDLSQDELKVAGKKITAPQAEELEYWIFHKPVRVVSTLQDPEGRRSLSQYIEGKTKARLFPVGRLDADSEGLLLLTNDGDLAYRLSHPKFEIAKEYLVWVNGIFSREKMTLTARGVFREAKTAFDAVEVVEKTGRDFCLRVVIHQGYKREIRRVCAKVGWEVKRLQRQKLASLELGNLAPGQLRPLTVQEVEALKASVPTAV